MNFLKRMSGGIKKVLGIALVSALLSQAVAPIANVKATDGPRFNFLEDDLPLLRGANKSLGETVWHKPLEGSAGDTFAGIIYYHNGMKDTVAKDTVINVHLPEATTDGKLVIGASVSASNAGTVSDGMILDLGQDATVSLIPGTVQWFPNFRSFGTPPSPLLDGQTGEELFGDGLYLGPINGCWDYIGYVVFQFKTDVIPEANIVQSKIAKNLTTGEEGTDIQAEPGDQVLYSLVTRNTGEAPADIVISDDISDVLELSEFLSASLGGTLADGRVIYPVVRINPGETVVRTFTVGVFDPQPDNAINGKHFDGVMENCYGNWVFVRIGKKVPGMPCLKIQKSVRNVTINETGFSKENQAKSGDMLEYKITYTNTGESADNITITDTLPVNVSYIPGSTVLIKDGANQNVGDALTTDGLEIGSLEKGEMGTIIFKVRIASGLASGEVLTNTACLWFNKAKICDTARTKIVAKPIPVTPGLPMTGPEAPILSLLFTTTGALYLKLRKAKNALFLLKK